VSLFKRQLAKCGKTITLQNRDIVAPLFGDTNFEEQFSGDQDVQAIIKTVSGKTHFDGVSTETNITHEIRIEYVAGVTAETWILFNSRRIDILAVENCCEENRILILTCSERGAGEAAKA
jgi:SPP1 family predicted phage head-tail adaptor